MKHLTITLLTLLMSMGAWANEDLKTIDDYIGEFESKIDYEGKTLDIQYLMIRKCAAVVDTLKDLDIDYGYVEGLIQVSVGFRMMIGGNKPSGLDKTRDEIFEEVRTDVKEFKVQYVNHLSAWHSNKDQETDKDELSEELFSDSFREDLSLCFEVAKRLPAQD